MVACNPTLGFTASCVLAFHGRFLLRILLPAQQELQTGGCGNGSTAEERTLYKSEKERQLLLNHERDFFTGTAHKRGQHQRRNPLLEAKRRV